MLLKDARFRLTFNGIAAGARRVHNAGKMHARLYFRQDFRLHFMTLLMMVSW